MIARRGSVLVVGVDTLAGDGRAHLIGDTKFAFELLEVRRGGGICSRRLFRILRASGNHRIGPYRWAPLASHLQFTFVQMVGMGRGDRLRLSDVIHTDVWLRARADEQRRRLSQIMLINSSELGLPSS